MTRTTSQDITEQALIEAVEKQDVGRTQYLLAQKKYWIFVAKLDPNTLIEGLRIIELALILNNEDLIRVIRKAGGRSRFDEKILRQAIKELEEAVKAIFAPLFALAEMIFKRHSIPHDDDAPHRPLENSPITLKSAWIKIDATDFITLIQSGERPDTSLFFDALTEKDPEKLAYLFACTPTDLLTLQNQHGHSIEQVIARNAMLKIITRFTNELGDHFNVVPALEKLNAQIPTTSDEAIALFVDTILQLNDANKQLIKAYWDNAQSLPYSKIIQRYKQLPESERSIFHAIQNNDVGTLKTLLTPPKSSSRLFKPTAVSLPQTLFCGLTPAELAAICGSREVQVFLVEYYCALEYSQQQVRRLDPITS